MHQLPPVEDDIYDYLISRAIPLEDDINSLLRRLLGMDGKVAPDAAPPPRPAATSVSATRGATPRRKAAKASKSAKRTKRTRALKGSIVREADYQIPILRALEETGGRGASSEVIDRVGKLLDDRLGEADRETISSGDVRWRNRAQFVRLSLIKSGDMKADSPRGMWEISDQGRTRLGQEG